MAPIANDDDQSFATAQTSCFTRKPTSNKHVAFAEIDDFSEFESHRTLKPPEPSHAEDYQDTTGGTADDRDEFSDQASTGTRIPEKKNNKTEKKSQDMKKPPGKYKSMKDTLKKVTAEMDNKMPTNSSNGPYQPNDMINPSQAPTQSDREGKG